MSHQPKHPPCGNAEYGCDNSVAEEGEHCDDCERRYGEAMERMARAYVAEKTAAQPKTGICARCKDNAVADDEGVSECCGWPVLDGGDLVDRAEMLMEDR